MPTTAEINSRSFKSKQKSDHNKTRAKSKPEAKPMSSQQRKLPPTSSSASAHRSFVGGVRKKGPQSRSKVGAHLLLLDLRHLGIDGTRIETTLDMASITLNKNLLPGDKSAKALGGIRIGTLAMTTRGFTKKEFIETADLVHRAVQIALQANSSAKGSTVQDFMNSIESFRGPLADLQCRVEHLTTQFPLPGI